MNYLDLFKRVSEIRNAAKKAHQLALSNRLANDEANEQFEKLDKKMYSFEKAVVEAFNLKAGEYNYEKPGSVRPNTRVTREYISGLLVASKNTLESLQTELKGTKYKVVDKSKNEIKNLSNGVRSLLTKAVADMNKTCDIYAPEQD